MRHPLLVLIQILLLLVVYILPGGAQNVQRATGSAQVRLESNLSKEDTRKKAEELAKIDAIQNVFGSYVQQQTSLTIVSGRSDFSIIGTTKVRGTWIRTAEISFSEESKVVRGVFGDENELWITCTIVGFVKPVSPKAAIEYQLRNCEIPECRTTSFLSGEQLYLSFKSPVRGHLSIFLDDGNMIYRLLPYTTSDNSSIVVNADIPYLFFSPKYYNDLPASEFIDEIELYTLRQREINYIYIVFSEVDYYKPILQTMGTDLSGYSLPKSLTHARFEEWLSNHREKYDDFIDIRIPIEIASN